MAFSAAAAAAAAATCLAFNEKEVPGHSATAMALIAEASKALPGQSSSLNLIPFMLMLNGLNGIQYKPFFKKLYTRLINPTIKVALSKAYYAPYP